MLKTIRLDIQGNLHEIDCFLPNYISGLWLKIKDPTILQIQRGAIALLDGYYYLDSYKLLTISNMPIIEGGSLEDKKLYYVYVRKNPINAISNYLEANDFFLSKKKPTRDFWNKSINFYEFGDNRTALYDSSHKYRCIGTLYHLSNGECLLQDKCYIGYWEGAWTDLNNLKMRVHRHNVVRHALGQIPKHWEIWFKPELGIYNAVPHTSYYIDSSSWWGVNDYGIRPDYRFTNVTAYFYAGSNIYYFRSNGYNGWQDSGVGKLIVRV